MNTYCRALCGALLLNLSNGAIAAPFSQIVAFGDSLTDSGQYPDPGGPVVEVDGESQPAAGLRFTNRVGPTYLPGAGEPTAAIAIQHVSERLGLGPLNPAAPILPAQLTGRAPGTNYAWGGAQTSRILASITEAAGATTTLPELDLQTQRDGYLVESPQADAAALYYINGGANDVFATLPDFIAATQTAATTGSAPPDVNSTVLQAAAANIAAGVSALHAAGARYIMVANLPDLATTPLLAGADAQLAAEAAQLAGAVTGGYSEATAQFNASLEAALRESGANVIPLNINGLLAEVAANPARFGFTAPQALSTCFDGSQGRCQENPAVGLRSSTPNPDQLLYADAVHPTARGQELIARYQTQVLTAPGEFALLGGLAQRAALWVMDQQLFPVTRVNGDNSARYRVELLGGVQRWTERNRLFEGLAADAQVEQVGLQSMVILNKHFSLAVAATINGGELEFEASPSSAEAEGLSAAITGTFNKERLQASLTIGAAAQDLEFSRATALGDYRDRAQTSDTRSQTTAVASQLQFDASFQPNTWQYGPYARALALYTELDGFSEAGPAASSLRVSTLEHWDYIAEAGAFIKVENAMGSLAGEFGYRRHNNDGQQDLEMQQLALPDTAPYLLPAISDANWGGITGAADASLRLTTASHISARYEIGYIDELEQTLLVTAGVSF